MPIMPRPLVIHNLAMMHDKLVRIGQMPEDDCEMQDNIVFADFGTPISLRTNYAAALMSAIHYILASSYDRAAALAATKEKAPSPTSDQP